MHANIEKLSPLYKALETIVLNFRYLQTDESHIKVQDGDKEGKCFIGQMWVSYNPQSKLVLFSYQKGRTQACLKDHLKNFKGKLQSDGHGSYNIYENDPTVELFACWAHARRYFYRALSENQKIVQMILDLICELYAIEDYCRQNDLSASDRQLLRQEKSRPILNELKRIFDDLSLKNILPSSLLGKALNYTNGLWARLIKFVDHGEVEIDNNLIESKIRPLALGRKNYMFAGSHESAQRAAMLYSFFASCKVNNIDPYEWLLDVLNRIADHPIKQIEVLLPQKWTRNN